VHGFGQNRIFSSSCNEILDENNIFTYQTILDCLYPYLKKLLIVMGSAPSIDKIKIMTSYISSKMLLSAVRV
jgi:hypothetical protein